MGLHPRAALRARAALRGSAGHHRQDAPGVLALRSPAAGAAITIRACSSRTLTKGPVLARRQSPQTFEKRRREREKKRKKQEKLQERVWRNQEKKDQKLREEDPAAWAKLQEERRLEEESWYYYE